MHLAIFSRSSILCPVPVPIYAAVTVAVSASASATSSPSAKISADHEEYSNEVSQEHSARWIAQGEGEEKFTGREYGRAAEHSNTDQDAHRDSEEDRQKDGPAITDGESIDSDGTQESQNIYREGQGEGEGGVKNGEGERERERYREDNRVGCAGISPEGDIEGGRGGEREGEGGEGTGKEEVEVEVPLGVVLTVKSVSCGDFHTAAMTYSSQVFVWGACRVHTIPSSAPLSSSTTSFSSSSSALNSIKEDSKIDVTSHFTAAPKQVLHDIPVMLMLMLMLIFLPYTLSLTLTLTHSHSLSFFCHVDA